MRLRELQIVKVLDALWWSFKWHHVKKMRKDSCPNLQQSRSTGTCPTAVSAGCCESAENLALVEMWYNLKKQKYCTDVTWCHGDNWVRVWNCIRHASLMGRPRKNALNREGGREAGGHNPLTRISYHWRSINAGYLKRCLLNKTAGRGALDRGHRITLTD